MDVGGAEIPESLIQHSIKKHWKTGEICHESSCHFFLFCVQKLYEGKRSVLLKLGSGVGKLTAPFCKNQQHQGRMHWRKRLGEIVVGARAWSLRLDLEMEVASTRRSVLNSGP